MNQETTYSSVQLQLQEAFNKLNDVSIRLAGAKNALAKIEVEVKELETATTDSKEALDYIKKQDVISMEAYVYAQNRNEAFSKGLGDAKVQKLLKESEIKKTDKERLDLIAEYEALEKKLKSLSNNVIDMVQYAK